MERKLWNNVLVKAPEEDFNRHYNDMLVEPLDYFVKKMDVNIKVCPRHIPSSSSPNELYAIQCNIFIFIYMSIGKKCQ
jgi:hypothetical protein